MYCVCVFRLFFEDECMLPVLENDGGDGICGSGKAWSMKRGDNSS